MVMNIVKFFGIWNFPNSSLKRTNSRMNRRGFLRVLEVIIASLLVLSSVLIVVTNRVVAEESFCSEVPAVVEEIAKNGEFREEIINNLRPSDIDSFISERIQNPFLSHEFKICDPDDLCSLTEIINDDAEVCAAERIIGTDVSSTVFNPKKIKLFVYEG